MTTSYTLWQHVAHALSVAGTHAAAALHSTPHHRRVEFDYIRIDLARSTGQGLTVNMYQKHLLATTNIRHN